MNAPTHSAVRPDVVEILAQAALDGMRNHAIEASGDEVLSALFTLTLRSIQAVVDVGANVPALQDAVGRLYAAIPQERAH